MPSSMQTYLKEMESCLVPLLSRVKERQLAKKIEKGEQADLKLKTAAKAEEKNPLMIADLQKAINEGIEAKKQLATANLRLVVAIAKKFHSPSSPISLLGLIQEGNFGLMIAIGKFDWRKNTKFSTYATYWIKQAIYSALDFHKERFLSLDFLSEDSKNESLYDITEDSKARQPAEEADRKFVRQVIMSELSILNKKDAVILKLKFGIIDGVSHTIEEIAKLLGCSKQAIYWRTKHASERLFRHLRLQNLFKNLQ